MTKTNADFFRDALNSCDLWIAPLAGVSDIAYRKICLEFGAHLMTTEMISAKGLFYNNAATIDLLAIDPNETHTGVQIFGSDPQSISEAVKRHLNQTDFAFIDINMGCPVRKIISNGDGSALLADPKKMASVAKALVVASEKPVSAKIRIGIDEETINCVENVKILQDCGINAIAIHGRTRAQMYAGQADWEMIAKAKEIAEIPIIGNGDVDSFASYQTMKEHTSCDGVMIGRAIMGNPFLFEEILSAQNDRPYQAYTNQQKLDVALRHFHYLLIYKGEHTACSEFRKHLSWYTKGMPNSSHFRHEINRVSTKEELLEFVNQMKQMV